MPRYDDDDIVDALQMAAFQTGEPLTQTAYAEWRDRQPESQPSARTVADRFGGWRDACGAAGVAHSSTRRTHEYTEGELVDALRAAADRVDVPLTKTRYTRHRDQGGPDAATIADRLGGGDWQVACQRARVLGAVEDGPSSMTPRWTQATVAAAVGGWLAAQEGRPTVSEYRAAARDANTLPSLTTVQRYLDDWGTVLSLVDDEREG